MSLNNFIGLAYLLIGFSLVIKAFYSLITQLF